MKLNWQGTESFLKKPADGVPVVLIFGPDEGLARERADIVGKHVCPDLSDPFNVIDLPGDTVTENPARLFDACASPSLMGGKRLVRVRDVKDGLAAALKDFLAAPPPGNDYMVIILGGELSTRSPLRKLIEGAKNAAAMPCYNDDERSLRRLISDTFRDKGRRIDNDAVSYLATHLQSDRAVARAELEKLDIYMGAATSPVTLQDAIASLGAEAGVGMDDICAATANGDVARLERLLDIALREGMPPVTLVRVCQDHFRRLHLAHALRRETDMSLKDIMEKKIHPPVFFKMQDAFSNQLSLWGMPDILFAQSVLLEAEQRLKSTGYPDELIIKRCLFSLAMKATSLSRGARRA